MCLGGGDIDHLETHGGKLKQVTKIMQNNGNATDRHFTLEGLLGRPAGAEVSLLPIYAVLVFFLKSVLVRHR